MFRSELARATRDPVSAVTLADGKAGKVKDAITTTREHPFYLRGKGFVPAGRLAIGNAIVTRAGPDAVVEKVEWRRRAGGYKVHNLVIDDNHTYFVGTAAGGVWVHNANFGDANKLADHFARHRADFGAADAASYEAQARSFLTGPRDAMTLMKTRRNGDVELFNPNTDEFGVVSGSGVIQTYYKPNPATHGYPANLDYFNAQ